MTQLNHEDSLKAAEERAAQEQYKQDDERGLREVYAAFPQLIRNQATDRILRNYCGNTPVTLTVIAYGFSSLDSNLVEQVQFIGDKEARKLFIDKLVSLSGASQASQAFQRRQLEARVGGSGQSIVSTQELQQRATEKEKQVALRGMRPDDVVQLTKTSTDASLVGPTVAAENALKQSHRLLDGRFYPPIPADISSAVIKKMDSGTLRKLVRNHHAQQVNARLMERS